MTTKEQRRKDWSARIADYRASDLSMGSLVRCSPSNQRAVEVLATQTKSSSFRG